ncbi:MAG: hypothetical protein ACR2IQ_01330 [Minisyncoccia bacterium]
MKNIFKNINTPGMTDSEIRHMRTYLQSHTAHYPATTSQYFEMSWYLKTASAALSMLLITAGGITYGAQKSLPGDALYSVKLHIEEVKGMTSQTPKEKLLQQQSRLMTRFDEIETLVKSGAMTPEKQAVVTEQLSEHLDKVVSTVADVEKEATKENTEKEKTLAKTNVTEAIATATKITNEVANRQATITELANEKGAETKQIIENTNIALTIKTTEVKDAVTTVAAPKKDEAEALEADLNNIDLTRPADENLPAKQIPLNDKASLLNTQTHTQ